MTFTNTLDIFLDWEDDWAAEQCENVKEKGGCKLGYGNSCKKTCGKSCGWDKT